MEKVDLKVIYDIIRPCGLAPKKSKAIQDLSKILVDKFDGIVPKNINELEKLPGVGHKTASVVISQGFGLPAFPVDTHIHRLAQRWGLTNGKNVKQTEKDLKKLFPTERWNKLHLQIIFYGREFCSAWSCDGTICEICTTCYPKRKKPFKAKKN
jgi:endonuclease-3